MMRASERELSPKAISTAIACTIGMMVSVVPFHIGTFALFLQPVSQEFGWGRAQFAASLNMSAILAALAAPFVGRAVDRIGARRLLPVAITLYALAFMAQSQLSGHSKLQFYATYCALGFTEAVAGPVAFSHLISLWFHERRGLFLSLVIGAAPAVSIMIMAPVTHYLIADFGWRAAYLILGGIILVLGLPAMLFLLKDPQRAASASSSSSAASSATQTLPGKTVGAVLGTVTYWLILVALVIHSLVVGGVRAHTVALLSDRGLSIGIATLAVSIAALAGLAGNVVAGIFLDRVASPRIAIPFFISALVGLLVLHFATNAPLALTGAAILGFGIGAESGIGPYFFSRYFGSRSFGTIYGLLVSLLAISSGLGPMLLGLTFDKTGSYSSGLSIAEVGLAVGIVLVALLGPYIYPARRSIVQVVNDTDAPAIARAKEAST
jgi:MFS family permease